MMIIPALLLSTAITQTTPVIVAVHHEGKASEAAAVLLEHTMIGAISNLDDFVVVSKNQIWNPDQEAHLAGLTKEAILKQQEGRAAFEELEAELAIQAYQVAAETLLAQVDFVDRQAEALDAAAEYASVLQQLGEEDKAREIFRTILFVDSSYSGEDFKRLTDDDVGLLQDEEMALAFEVPGALMVTQGSAPVEVWIDGKMVGITPLTIDSLTPGLHFYALKRDGFQRRSGRFRLKSGEQKKIQGQLVRNEEHKTFTESLSKIDWQNKTNDAAVKSIGASLNGAPHLILLQVRTSEDGVAQIQALRWDATRGLLKRQIQYETSLEREELETTAAEIMASLFTTDQVGAPQEMWSAQAPQESEADAAPESGTSVWLWAGAGVAAGIGIGTLATVTGGMATYLVYTSAPTSSNNGQAAENESEDSAARFVVLGY